MTLSVNIHRYQVMQTKFRERRKNPAKANAGETLVNAGASVHLLNSSYEPAAPPASYLLIYKSRYMTLANSSNARQDDFAIVLDFWERPKLIAEHSVHPKLTQISEQTGRASVRCTGMTTEGGFLILGRKGE